MEYVPEKAATLTLMRLNHARLLIHGNIGTTWGKRSANEVI